MVNEQALLATIAAIEADLPHWNQETFVGHDYCGTTYCLAGWAVRVRHGEDDNKWPDMTTEQMATAILGLNPAQVDKLFYTFDNMGREDESQYLRYNGHAGIAAWESYRRLIKEVTGV